MAIIPKADDDEQLVTLIQVRITKGMEKRIAAVCEDTGRKQSDVVRRLITAGLDAYEREQKAGRK